LKYPHPVFQGHSGQETDSVL